MLADIKTRIEAARYFAWKAADHYDKTGGKDRELANMVKIFNSELSVQTVYDAMRLVGVEAYGDRTPPIASIMQDVLCFPPCTTAGTWASGAARSTRCSSTLPSTAGCR